MSDPAAPAVTHEPDAEAAAAAFRTTVAAIETQVGAAIVGQREAVRGVMISLILGGHALLEGVPGIGKTSMVRSFAGALGITHNRIQFTPDLMPADITGTVVLVDRPDHAPQLVFQSGPLFGSLMLADEINRASPARRAHCSRRCRRGLSRSATTRITSRGRSRCSRPRTRWRCRAPTPCRRRSSTAFS